ncbi:MAG: EamA family transporter [Rhodoferax sp.]|nr:EamA family transporter [Rhodoferax sp.]
MPEAESLAAPASTTPSTASAAPATSAKPGHAAIRRVHVPNPENLRGIGAMLVAVSCFSVMDALMKQLSGSYPSVQVAALRGLGALPLVTLYVLWRREVASLLRVRWPLHLLRGLANITTLSLFSYALKSLPLAEAYTIFFIAPLVITALSTVVLGEHVTRTHWAAIGVGLVGVVVALRPEQDAFFTLGALAVLGAASCYALSAIIGRVLTRTYTTASLVFWTTALVAVGGSLLARPVWVPVAPAHWPLIAGLAVSGFFGLLAITQAFRHGQAAVVAPFEYTALAWGVAFDWLFWHTVPDSATLLGGAIIIGSGLYVVRKERAAR